MNKKRISLVQRFTLMFLIFVAAALAMTGTLSYLNMTTFYHSEAERQLRNATKYMNSLVEADGEAFLNVKQYVEAHGGDVRDRIRIPMDFSGDYGREKAAFERLWSARYPGQSVSDIPFAELDEDVQDAYALYYYEYWLWQIERSREDFGLIYTYFVYPASEEDHLMSFLYDGFREEYEDRDDHMLMVAPVFAQDPEIHRYMWEAWETGSSPSGLDIVDNQYGHVYCYSEPLVLGGSCVGLMCAEVFVESVNGTIRDMALTQTALAAVVLLLCSGIMLFAIRSLVLRRILRLEGHMADYSANKDPALADQMTEELAALSYSDEITSLSGGFASLVRELDEYMRNLETVTAERERIGAELSVATEIQASMLPCIFPPFPDRKEFDLFASMDPAKEVGGDFYDFFMTDDRHLAAVIADVSGKGVPAALFMVIAKTLIKNHAQAGESAEDVLIHANNQLCEGNGGGLFVTAWIGLLDITTGELVFSDAGHEYPVLRHADGGVELLKPQRKRPPLAAMEGLRYQANHVQLKPGDMLFLYTDGVPEATNANNELYGMERLDALIRSCPAETPEELLRAVRADVDRFVGDAPQFDDLTMLAIRLNETED